MLPKRILARTWLLLVFSGGVAALGYLASQDGNPVIPLGVFLGCVAFSTITTWALREV
jgi:hypothetical protein